MLPPALGTLGRCPKEPDHTVRLKVTPYVLKQKSSIESRLKRFSSLQPAFQYLMKGKETL